MQIGIDFEPAEKSSAVEEAGRIHVFPRELFVVDQGVVGFGTDVHRDVCDVVEGVVARGYFAEVGGHFDGVL